MHAHVNCHMSSMQSATCHSCIVPSVIHAQCQVSKNKTAWMLKNLLSMDLKFSGESNHAIEIAMQLHAMLVAGKPLCMSSGRQWMSHARPCEVCHCRNCHDCHMQYTHMTWNYVENLNMSPELTCNNMHAHANLSELKVHACCMQKCRWISENMKMPKI